MIRSMTRSSVTNEEWYRSMRAGFVEPISDFELIETIDVTSIIASVSFSNLGAYSSTYRHLQIRYVGKSTGTVGNINLTFNGLGGTAYARHHLNGNGSTVTSAAVTSQNRISMLGSVVTAGSPNISMFGAGVIDIIDAYSTTKNKTVRAFYGTISNNNGIYLTSGLLNNTVAVSSITLAHDGNNFEVGSRFSIYGIRG